MVESPADLPPLIGESPEFSEMLEQVSRVAPLDRPVLVVGERGTGIFSRLTMSVNREKIPMTRLLITRC